MAALTTHKKRFAQYPYGAGTGKMNVAASTKIYDGAIIAKDASGNAVPAPATGALFFAGIAVGGYDNSAVASATTDFPLTVETGQYETLLFDVAVTIADKGKPVYYINDGTVSLTIVAGTGVAQSQVGIVQGTSSGNDGVVNTLKAVSA